MGKPSLEDHHFSSRRKDESTESRPTYKEGRKTDAWKTMRKGYKLTEIFPIWGIWRENQLRCRGNFRTSDRPPVQLPS